MNLDVPMVKVAEAAKLLAISKEAIYQAMRRGEIRYMQRGRSRSIPREALEEYVAARMKGGWALPAPNAGSGATPQLKLAS